MKNIYKVIFYILIFSLSPCFSSAQNISFDWHIGDSWLVKNSMLYVPLNNFETHKISDKFYKHIHFKVVDIKKINNRECFDIFVKTDNWKKHLFIDKSNYNLLKITNINKNTTEDFYFENEIVFENHLLFYMCYPIVSKNDENEIRRGISQEMIPYKNGYKIVMKKKTSIIPNPKTNKDYKITEIIHYWEPNNKWWIKSQKYISGDLYRYDKSKSNKNFIYVNRELLGNAFLEKIGNNHGE